MIRSDLLERFILGFGLAIADNGLGRPTTITPLWLAAKDQCGECSIDEVLDSLYNLNPQHAELYKFVAIGGGFQSVSFERRRNTPQWQDFFTRGDFRIKVLPLGRRRFEEMSESGATSQHPTRQTNYNADLDRRFARLAIEEALKSVPEDERPHPKVGAVVVKDGTILSRAHRGEKEKSHAEYVALEDKLSDDLISGSTVYTTLEPCTTRTHPKIPCAQRLIDRRVACVVIGMFDPNPTIWGRGWQRLREAGIETRVFDHDLMQICEEMNRDFARAQKENQMGTKPIAATDNAAMIAARSLTDATRNVQKAAWSFFAHHTQFGVARGARDVVEEEKQILEKLEAALNVFTQDYDTPSDLSAVVQTELGNINIAWVNLKSFSMTGQVADMKVSAIQIQEACERIRVAAKPYAYRRAAANP
jgi:pyrimidine deaminase RibD-like protein